MAKAVGILEVFGLVAGFVAADAGCKAADVAIENFDKNNPVTRTRFPCPSSFPSNSVATLRRWKRR